jgi:exopolysaccharide biosynthesis polyprenyl glycosylphosphotransferase
MRKMDVESPGAEFLRDQPVATRGSTPLAKVRLTFSGSITKRVCDILFAIGAIVCLSPLLVIAALAIRLEGPGPVIFRQRRTGLNGRPFVIYKFRTMSVVEDGSKITQAQRDDPRVTKVGRLLRQSSIDELPQFLNVLKGEMSLVGPRPHPVAFDQRYGALIPDYVLRHRVKPGITGWAQVTGLRGETATIEAMEKRVKMDLWYIEHQSPLLDLRIAWLTCVEILRSRAY